MANKKEQEQTIMDSRQAAMDLINIGNEQEKKRKKSANMDWTDTGVEKRGALVDPEDFTDSGIQKSINAQKKKNAVRDFFRIGRKKELKNKAASNKEKQESAFDLAERIREMSDEEFDNAVANGTLTPEQIRKAGEYEFDIYMGDVWVEDPDNDDKPEPTYEEFMSDPVKYGYDAYGGDEWKFYRYNPNRYKK